MLGSNKVSLSEICDLIPGFAFKSRDFTNTCDKVIKIADIQPPYVFHKDLKSVNISGYKKEKLAKFIAKSGDLVLAMTGATIGKLGRLQRGHAYVNQRVLLLKPKENIDKDYFYYSLLGVNFQKFILNHIDSQTAQPNISATTIGKYTIPIPSLEEQKRIGKILRSLDRKIELNLEINDNLLQILGHLYQQRFNLSVTTKNKGVLSDICCYSTEKVNTSKLNEETYFSTENMLVNKQGAIEATNLPSITQVTACHSGDTLVSNIRPYFKKIVYCYCDCGCSADVLCFHPKQALYSQYLFCILYADTFFKFVEAGSKGTKMPRGDRQQIMNYPVKLAIEQELKEFNVIAKPILEQINNNNFENKKLAMLRDMLLSKLITASSRFS